MTCAFCTSDFHGFCNGKAMDEYGVIVFCDCACALEEETDNPKIENHIQNKQAC